MKSAYYSRNESYSRSYNAECAEREGRLPRTRAAAALGVSAEAFRAGCRAADYHCDEWHHVGKYATPVNYYDTKELRGNVAFWRGAASAYSSKAKRAEMERHMQAAKDANKDEFRRCLERQRDCTRRVLRHDGHKTWQEFVERKLGYTFRLPVIFPGDMDAVSYCLLVKEVEKANRLVPGQFVDLLIANATSERVSRKGGTVYCFEGFEVSASSHPGWVFVRGLARLTSAAQTDGCKGWGGAPNLYQAAHVLEVLKARTGAERREFAIRDCREELCEIVMACSPREAFEQSVSFEKCYVSRPESTQAVWAAPGHY